MSIPSNEEYEKALSIVEAFESREKFLSQVNEEMFDYLGDFSQYNFDIDEYNRIIFFAGVTNNGVLLTSRFRISNDFSFNNDNITIGKLICVKKSLSECWDYLRENLESDSNLTERIDLGLVMQARDRA